MPVLGCSLRVGSWGGRGGAARALAALVWAIMPVPACAQCSYTINEIWTVGCPPPWNPSVIFPQGLNDLGDMVGYRRECPPNDDFYWAIRWTPGTGLETLPMPPGGVSARAYAINDAGLIVGDLRTTTHDEWACVWTEEGVIEIPPLNDGQYSTALGVNNSGSVVGWRWVSPTSRQGFVWNSGDIADIEPALHGFDTGDAVAISDSGFVAGTFGDPGNLGRAYRWHKGQVDILEPLPGCYSSQAFDVNEYGVVVGQCRATPPGVSPILSLPASWLGTNAMPLPILPGYQGGAGLRVNAAGLIAGEARKPFRPGLPSILRVVWAGGTVTAMKDLIVPPPNGVGQVMDINTPGQILIQASPQTSWVLAPFPAAPGDLNGDCQVDGADLGRLLGAWGQPDPVVDLDGDGTVSGADLGILLGNWSAP